jgi:DNA-directed RNA polymerase subunit RPC12/RpoP
MRPKLKSDKYRKARDGCSRLLDVHCEHCGAKILAYQKDGPGSLKRLYLDRIFTPENLASLQKLAIDQVPNLSCPECKTVLALPYIYKKEQRKAFRLLAGLVTKKIAKSGA